MSKDDMDKSEKQKIKEIRPIIRKWFDWLIWKYDEEETRNN